MLTLVIHSDYNKGLLTVLTDGWNLSYISNGQREAGFVCKR